MNQTLKEIRKSKNLTQEIVSQATKQYGLHISVAQTDTASGHSRELHTQDKQGNVL